MRRLTLSSACWRGDSAGGVGGNGGEKTAYSRMSRSCPFRGSTKTIRGNKPIGQCSSPRRGWGAVVAVGGSVGADGGAATGVVSPGAPVTTEGLGAAASTTGDAAGEVSCRQLVRTLSASVSAAAVMVAERGTEFEGTLLSIFSAERKLCCKSAIYCSTARMVAASGRGGTARSPG